MITRPVRERSITTVGQMVREGLEFSGFSEVGLLSLSVGRPLRDRRHVLRVWPSSTTAPTYRCRCPRPGWTRSTSTWPRNCPATVAAPVSTFAPEGGSERIRKVINKMVTEEDLIRTVVTAYTNGWRQVKLYFMCGLPTETDDDVVQIARMAHEVIKAGRAATGSQGHPLHGVDRRVRAQAAHAVPVGGDGHAGDHRPPAQAAQGRDQRGPLARPGDRVPLPRRRAVADRGPAVARRPSRRRRDPAGLGRRWPVRRLVASTSRSSAGWTRPPAELPGFGVDLDWFTTRERDELEVLPWDHLDSGLDKDWLWKDWQDSVVRVRAGRLPVDAVLRLRRVPEHGHRDPDRPDRPETAAADAGRDRPSGTGVVVPVSAPDVRALPGALAGARSARDDVAPGRRCPAGRRDVRAAGARRRRSGVGAHRA